MKSPEAEASLRSRSSRQLYSDCINEVPHANADGPCSDLPPSISAEQNSPCHPACILRTKYLQSRRSPGK